jgi:hypothetical protein
MTHYLLSVYQPDGPAPPPAELEKITQDVGALNEQLKAAGAWVFTGGLCPPGTATVLRPAGDRGQQGEVLVTGGPYVAGREHLGGFTIIEAPDLDSALRWGRKCTQVTGLPVEVRMFAGVG